MRALEALGMGGHRREGPRSKSSRKGEEGSNNRGSQPLNLSARPLKTDSGFRFRRGLRLLFWLVGQLSLQKAGPMIPLDIPASVSHRRAGDRRATGMTEEVAAKNAPLVNGQGYVCGPRATAVAPAGFSA